VRFSSGASGICARLVRRVVRQLVDRYYDPTTDQFLSVDPDLAETGQPYAFTGDDPLNKTDPLGLAKRIKRLGSNTKYYEQFGIVATTQVIGRNRSDRAKGLVRVQTEVSVNGTLHRYDTKNLSVTIVPENGLPSFDQASPYDILKPQSAAHTSLALQPGTQFHVHALVNTVANGHFVFDATFTVPDESVYDVRNPPSG
jgi:hypothetical protein